MSAVHQKAIDFPKRIFLDSSALQTLQDYGEFLYEDVYLEGNDRIYRDPAGIAKLEALRCIMRVAERAPFQFTLSDNSFREVSRRGDNRYLQWAYDVLDHWHICLCEGPVTAPDHKIIERVESPSYDYMGLGDRALLRDALLLSCDTFLTMENKLPRNAAHIQRTLGIRVVSPVGMWGLVRPWAALFY